MEILFLTTTSNLLGVASRLADEGHTIKLYGGRSNGFVEAVRHPFEAIKSCKFIVADGAVDSKCWEWAKSFNKPIIGSNPLTDMLNRDVYREWQIAHKLGVELPDTEVINDISDMYEKVLEWNNARTLIRYDRECIAVDHQRWLAWAMDKLPLNKRILLQKPMFGEEVQVVGWYDGLKWARPFLLKTANEESMRAATMLGLYKRDWVDKLIQPWETFLRSVEYRGPFRVKAYISKKAVQTVECFAGIEFPSIYAFLEGLKEPVGDFLHKIAFSVCEEIDFTTDYASSVIVGTALKEPDGAPVVGFDEGNRKHIFFGNVDRRDDDIVIAKKPDWVYALTAHGRNLDEAFGRVYFTHGLVRIPEPNIMTGLAPLHGQWFNRLRDLGHL